MEAIVERCCGIDVHSAELVVCVLLGPADRKPRKEIRRFPTFSRDLLELRDWLAELGVTHIAMESTGMYWKPVYAVFEGDFEVIVGNAHHIKNVPGRKTDVKDSEWIADLVRHGLIRASFVPPEPIRRLRDLLRYRRKLVQARTAERNRLLNVLEQANIKLACVASDVFGVSGMRMLEAMSHGESDPRKLAALALGRLRAKLDGLHLALDGGLDEHHRFMLDIQLGRLRQLDDDLKRLHTKIEELLLPLQEKRELLTQIPGVGPLAAAIILSEPPPKQWTPPTSRKYRGSPPWESEIEEGSRQNRRRRRCGSSRPRASRSARWPRRSALRRRRCGTGYGRRRSTRRGLRMGR